MTIVPEPVIDSQAACIGDIAWKQIPISDLNTTITVPENINYNSSGPRPDQVILLTATDGQGNNGGIKNIVQLAEENRKAYCNYHGYIYHFINISKYDLGDSHAVWKKIPAIVEAFNTYPDAQWVFWLDLDAIIMTPQQDLNSLLLSKHGMQTSLAAGDRHHNIDWDPMNTFQQAEVDFENTDMLMAQDHNGLNAGSFLIRRSKYTQWLLDMWADPFFMHMTWPGREQEALVRIRPHPSQMSNLLMVVDTLYPSPQNLPGTRWYRQTARHQLLPRRCEFYAMAGRRSACASRRLLGEGCVPGTLGPVLGNERDSLNNSQQRHFYIRLWVCNFSHESLWRWQAIQK